MCSAGCWDKVTQTSWRGRVSLIALTSCTRVMTKMASGISFIRSALVGSQGSRLVTGLTGTHSGQALLMYLTSFSRVIFRFVSRVMKPLRIVVERGITAAAMAFEWGTASLSQAPFQFTTIVG